MSTKISQTLSIAGGNLSRPTRFTAMIAPPPEVCNALGGSGGAAKTFDVLCKSIKVPDITMQTIDILYKGHKVGIPGRVNQEQTIELTMYLDEHHALRQIFHDWIAGIDDRFYAVSSAESANMQQTKNIFGNLIIKARDYDESTNEVMNYLIEGCYPISVSGPGYDGGATGEVQEFTVTLQFWRFLSKDTGSTYDDVDGFLDSFGLSPQDYSNLASLGSAGSLIGQANKAFGSVKRAASALGGLF